MAARIHSHYSELLYSECQYHNRNFNHDNESYNESYISCLVSNTFVRHIPCVYNTSHNNVTYVIGKSTKLSERETIYPHSHNINIYVESTLKTSFNLNILYLT